MELHQFNYLFISLFFYLCIYCRSHGIYGRYILRTNLDEKRNSFKFFNLVYKFWCQYGLEKSIVSYGKSVLNDEYHGGEIKAIFNDPGFHKQWFFFEKFNSSFIVTKNTHRNSITFSHELERIWASGVTGKGIIIALVGGGVEVYHKDLYENFEQHLSYNFIDNNQNIVPSHKGGPTRSIGLACAVGNNRKCGVGSAPLSRFANLQIFDDKMNVFSDYKLAKALIHEYNSIHIYLINWILNFKLEMSLSIGPLTISSLESSAMYGRFGMGSLFIIGSGDSRIKGNNCAFNGFIQRPEVFVFGVFSKTGSTPDYLERCSAVLASSISTEAYNSSEKLYTTTSDNHCNYSTGGSFAAGAISSGIIALLLSNNPTLTARKIMNLIILSSTQYDKNSIMNAAGFSYSYFNGYGLIRVNDLLLSSHSQTIQHLMPEHICHSTLFQGRIQVTRRNAFSFLVYSSGCVSTGYCVTKIEQIYMIISIRSHTRKSIRLFLVSPSGTKLRVLEPRPFDNSADGLINWRLKIHGYFGEKTNGLWKLEISSRLAVSILSSVELIFYGTCLYPEIAIAYHKKVLDLIRQNHHFFNHYNLIHRCSFDSSQYKELSGRDLCSFTEEEFSFISTIDYLT